MGCERTPNLIHAAARIRTLRALGNPASEHGEHSRHLIHARVQACEVGIRQHAEITCQEDMIIEFTCRAQGNR